MKRKGEIASVEKVEISDSGEDGFSGTVRRSGSPPLRFIASWGGEWDHVSVSLGYRCPTWEEMAYVKDIFFKPDECAIQFHPPKENYVNIHPFCLHLWRPQNEAILMPPTEFVGPIKGA